jgi:hypothetical protein
MMAATAQLSAHSELTQSIKSPENGRIQAKSENNSLAVRLSGGGRGIRTPDTLSGITVFKTVCFNRSHIPPRDWYQQFTSTLKSSLGAPLEGASRKCPSRNLLGRCSEQTLHYTELDLDIRPILSECGIH